MANPCLRSRMALVSRTTPIGSIYGQLAIFQTLSVATSKLAGHQPNRISDKTTMAPNGAHTFMTSRMPPFLQASMVQKKAIAAPICGFTNTQIIPICGGRIKPSATSHSKLLYTKPHHKLGVSKNKTITNREAFSFINTNIKVEMLTINQAITSNGGGSSKNGIMIASDHGGLKKPSILYGDCPDSALITAGRKKLYQSPPKSAHFKKNGIQYITAKAMPRLTSTAISTIRQVNRIDLAAVRTLVRSITLLYRLFLFASQKTGLQT